MFLFCLFVSLCYLQCFGLVVSICSRLLLRFLLIVSFTLEMQNFLISISCFSSSLALTRILFFVCSLFAVIMNIFPVCFV